MRLEEAFVAYLSGHAGLSALVADRIHPLRLPQEPTLPAIVYQRISAPMDGYAHDGPGNLAHPRYQFSCYAADRSDEGGGYDVVARVAEQLRTALAGFSGTMGSANLRVDAACIENELEDWEPEPGRMKRLMDVRFWAEEATP